MLFLVLDCHEVYNILLKWLIFDIIKGISTRDGVICISQEVIFFFDESGVLHKNEPSGYFIYAGYVFTDRSTLESAKRKYIHANKALKKALGQTSLKLRISKLNINVHYLTL